MLWIAFKFCSFVIDNNRTAAFGRSTPLWIAFKFCSFVIDNNANTPNSATKSVVNCFQIL